MIRKLLERLYPHVKPQVRWALITAASVWRRLLWRTRFIAISGSVGKTTAKDAIALVLGAHFATHATSGSRNHYSGVSLSILRTRPWHRYAVIEVGIEKPGQMRELAALVRPDIAVLTQVALNHVQSMKTIETVAFEKTRLPEALRAGGVAILNRDNPWLAAYEPAPGVRLVRYGSGSGMDLVCSEVRACWPDRLSFTVEHAGHRQRIQTQLVGEHWVSSVLPAVAVGLEAGLTLEQCAAALSRLQPHEQRLEPVTTQSGVTFLRDEFAGSLFSFGPALEVMRQARAVRKIVVSSDVGYFVEHARKRLTKKGAAVAACADIAVFVGEHNQHAVSGAVDAGMPRESVLAFHSPQQAAEELKRIASPGDLVLIRGLLRDHLSRVYLHMVEDVTCWKTACSKKTACDVCPELRRLKEF